MGKVTQLAFGVVNAGNINVNLMSANITTGAGSAADLITDLKAVICSGASAQTPSRSSRAFSSACRHGPGVLRFVTKPSDLGQSFPAPAALVVSVARALTKGLGAPSSQSWSIFWRRLGHFSLLPILFPKRRNLSLRVRQSVWDGTAVVQQLPVFLRHWRITSWRKFEARRRAFPVASGVIAGGSLMGIALIFWANGTDISRILANLVSGK
jgi:hypothetical protein